MYELALLLQATICAFVAHYWFVKRAAPVYNPVSFYIIFHIISFVIRPVLAYMFSFRRIWIYMRISPDDVDLFLALAVSSVGLLMLVAGYRFAESMWAAPLVPQFNVRIDRHDRRAFYCVLFLLGPLAIYSASIQLEGFDFAGRGKGIAIVQDFATGVTALSGNTGYIVSAHNFLVTLVLGAVVLSRFNKWSFLLVAAFIGYRAYIGWSRWAAVILLMAIVIAWLSQKNRRWPPASVFAGAVAVLAGFQIIGFNRDILREMLSGVSSTPNAASLHRSFIERLDNADFANFEYLVYIVRAVPDLSQTYTYFTQYLQLLTEPIPRMLWEGKPLGAPIQLVNLMNYGYFWGLTPSLVGDGWLSLGWFGVALTLFLAGMALAFFHFQLTKPRSGLYRHVAYSLFVVIGIQWYRDGGISIFKFALFTMLPVIIWFWISGLMRRVSMRRTPSRKIRAARPTPMETTPARSTGGPG